MEGGVNVDNSAKCAGLHWLFDSTLQADHEQAAALCAQCPVIDWCRDRLRQEETISSTMRAAGGGPRGTWAGQLVGQHERPAARRRVARCATDSGYFRHRRYNEPVCAECQIAHRLAERARTGRAS